ncbi:MAG: hypothetical protein IT370_02660 [Deltaproteobacteria bacterium]|nr:hypothetical protein [Deltaproteobacteria bacterium]
MRHLAILAAGVALSLAACDKKKPASGGAGAPVVTGGGGRAPRGLPPMDGQRMGVHDNMPAAGGSVGGAADPHAGLDMGAGGMGQGGTGDPHAGLDMGGAGSMGAGGDPHAGMNMGQGAAGDPHAGMNMGQGAAGAPGAAAAAGPSLISGTVDVAPAFKDKVPVGAVVFVSARSLKTKSIVAVARLVVDKLPLSFELSAASSMTGGAATLGAKDKVLLTLVVDKDGDPMKKQGEVEAMLEVDAPAKDLKLTFDHIREAP